MHKAFTLIELLVVVLIIGILAAIAVPQYQLAVEKAKLLRYMPIVDSILKAQEVFYMANGHYALDLTQLDLDLSQIQGCQLIKNEIKCPHMHFDNAGAYTQSIGKLNWRYCPEVEGLTSWNTCNSTFTVTFYYQNPVPPYTTREQTGTRKCSAPTAHGKKLIKMFCNN